MLVILFFIFFLLKRKLVHDLFAHNSIQVRYLYYTSFENTCQHVDIILNDLYSTTLLILCIFPCGRISTLLIKCTGARQMYKLLARCTLFRSDVYPSGQIHRLPARCMICLADTQAAARCMICRPAYMIKGLPQNNTAAAPWLYALTGACILSDFNGGRPWFPICLTGRSALFPYKQ